MQKSTLTEYLLIQEQFEKVHLNFELILRNMQLLLLLYINVRQMFLAQFHLENRKHQGNQLFLCSLRLNQKGKFN